MVKLAAAVFRLSEIERRAVGAGFKSLLSPEISSDVMWFLRRWTLTYLAGQENLYSDMSLAILAAFGQNTEGIGQFFLPLVHRFDNRWRWCCGRFHFRQRRLELW